MPQVSGGGIPRESVVGRPKANAKCQDGGAERAVLAAILRHGADGFMEIEEIVGAKDFYWPVNQRIFNILRHLVHERDARTFDEPTILAGAKAQGMEDFAGRAREQEYLGSLFAEHVSLDNARSLATVVFKLSMARAAYYTTLAIQKSLGQMTGEEKITDILGLVENPIFDFTSKLTSTNETLVPLGLDFAKQMQTQMTHPVDVVGLPTCFPNWDKAIGGGQRRGTVNLVGSRPKRGKCTSSFRTAILTNRGVLMPYEMFDAKANQKVTCSDLELLDQHGQSRRASHWWNNGLSEVVDIETKQGTRLSVTPDHPVRVLAPNGCIAWRNAGDLRVGDYLVHRCGDRYWGDRDVDPDDAYIIGLLVGDGSISNRMVEMSSCDDECRDLFRAFIQRRGGTMGSDNPRYLRCNLSRVAKGVAELGFYTEQRFKIFPKQIRMANERAVCQALSGYFDADGTVGRNGITAYTNSEMLSIQLRALLRNLGIMTVTYTLHDALPQWDCTRPYWATSIQGIESARVFRDLIGFRIARKRKALEEFCNRPVVARSGGVVPHLAEPLRKLKTAVLQRRGYFLRGNVNLRVSSNSWIRGAKRALRCTVEKLLNEFPEYRGLPEYRHIQSLIDPHLLFEPVKHLSWSKAWTCDFYVPDGHSFITNGVISHNSMFCLNVAYHAAKTDIPVLLLDTELNRQTQMNRLAALASNVELNRIETGQFGSVPEEREAVLSVREPIESLPITYCSIAGQSLRCVLSLARRWLMRNVGLDDAGQAKPCLLIYDYIKLMNADDLKGNISEFQILGFLLTELHNWALRWGLPILATVQLNRDGVEKEGGQVIAGSDRILWLCSSFTILKRKLKEELAEDPPAHGTHKLVVTDTRYGPAMEPTDYINVKSQLKCARFVEGKTWSQELANSATDNTPIEEPD